MMSTHSTLSKSNATSPSPVHYILDTNVLIHDPNAVLNFEEHHVIIPMTVLEELDKLKSGRNAIAADCRQAIRIVDELIGGASPEEIEQGVPIPRGDKSTATGCITILNSDVPDNISALPFQNNDNRIINHIVLLQKQHSGKRFVLVTKDINMRLKARGCGIESEDYHNDQAVADIEQLITGYVQLDCDFWDLVTEVESEQHNYRTYHHIAKLDALKDTYPNQFIIDTHGLVARVVSVEGDALTLMHLDHERLMQQETWSLTPHDVYQAMAMNLLLDQDVHIVNLTGSAGSGKTILALAAALELTINQKAYRRIIVTRSIHGLDKDIGFLPGTEQEKMEPWLGAITDNLEALHCNDEDSESSIDFVMSKVPLQFKSLNYIRGRSFQNSLIIIDESQNLTPHQIKAIVTRAGKGSKVVCIGNLAQIDTPYLSATSSGLTYLVERFKGFQHGGNITLQGVPRSVLAEYAETNL